MGSCLLRALCCLYNSRGVWHRTARGPRRYRMGYYDDDDEEELYTDDDDDEVDGEPNMKTVWKKQAAIAATTDVINAKRLLNKHTGDSGLLMYHDRRAVAMNKAFDRLSARDNRATKSSRFARNSVRGDIV